MNFCLGFHFDRHDLQSGTVFLILRKYKLLATTLGVSAPAAAAAAFRARASQRPARGVGGAPGGPPERPSRYQPVLVFW